MSKKTIILKSLIIIFLVNGLYFRLLAQPPIKTTPGALQYVSTHYGRVNPAGNTAVRLPDNKTRSVLQHAEPSSHYNFYWDERFDSLGLNGPVNAIAALNGNIYVGGAFTAAGEKTLNHIAMWSGSGWQAKGEGLERPVMNISFYDDDVYAGGWFFDEFGIRQNYIAVWNGTSWNQIFSMANDQVIAVVVAGGQVYVGGDFTDIEGESFNYIARWNGANWEPLGNGTNAPVRAIAVKNDTVYAGGDFTQAGGAPASFIAMWDGQNWHPMGDGLDGSVWALSTGEKAVYAGGVFTRAGGVPCSNIARWYTGQWSPLGSGTTARINALFFLNGEILVGGEFNAAGNKPAGYFSIWHEPKLATIDYVFDKPGWTMLSVPVLPFYTDKFTIFGAVSPGPALEFLPQTQNYKPVTDLECGKGYWFRIDKPGMVSIQGEPLYRQKEQVSGGWQMIGSVYHPIYFADPQDTPDHNVANQLLGWDFTAQTYMLTDLLIPGGSYWIFAGGPGELVLDGSVTTLSSGMSKILNADILSLNPPKPPTMDQLKSVPITTESFQLRQNYPNPFNPQTTIEFSLYRAVNVSVKVYNIRGELVRSLQDQFHPAGSVRLLWDGCNDNGSRVPSGVYYVKVTAGDYGMTIKAVLTK
ncbi:T9SS type A sorting domain-containing protein [candidate division KSB1 bacterium]|nr:T9SS type A sorting domain-containing protein [candidate division KSB1 bacterium]